GRLLAVGAEAETGVDRLTHRLIAQRAAKTSAGVAFGALTHGHSPLRRIPPYRGVIPAARRADWYARRVGVAAAREINEIPAARQSTDESRVRAAGVRRWRVFRPSTILAPPIQQPGSA